MLFWKNAEQKNLEEAHAKASATEQKLSGKYDEYMRTWTEDRGRPHFIMDKMLQMIQSNDAKSLNLTKDFEDLLDMAQPAGGWGRQSPRNTGLKKRMTNSPSHSYLGPEHFWTDEEGKE